MINNCPVLACEKDENINVLYEKIQGIIEIKFKISDNNDNLNRIYEKITKKIKILIMIYGKTKDIMETIINKNMTVNTPKYKYTFKIKKTLSENFVLSCEKL